MSWSVSDPAGWYPDPTTRHELRYWDGYAWLDNVSDKGAAANDPLGGKPMPPPSEAAAKAQQGPAPSAKKSKTPLFIGIGVAAVIIIVAAVVLTSGGGGGGTKATALADKKVTFDDDVKDVVHPTLHTVHIKANTVVLITVKSDDSTVEPGVVVLAQQKTVDDVAAKIEGSKDLLSSSLKNACSNLREEDIGAKGTVVFLARASDAAGQQLDAFMVVPIEGDFEFVPVLVNDKGQCEAGKSSLDLDPKFLDFSDVKNIDDLSSAISNDSDLSQFNN